MTVAIVGAMDEEIAYFKKHMSINKEKKIAHVLFYEGELEGKQVVLLKSGIGKVNATIATTLLMEYYKPSEVINTGSAGGLKDECQVGDVVIANEVIHHDADATAFGYEKGQIPQMPKSFPSDKKILKMSEDILANLDIAYHIGLIGTADTFMADERKVSQVKDDFPNMIAAEMEAAAIAQVCYQYKTPFIVMRALSDIAGKKSDVTFDQFIDQAAKQSTNFILEYLKQV